jgi:hypothetical protein
VSTDLRLIAPSLGEFYNFSRKSVIAVGVKNAAELIECARYARFVIAVDCDEGAIDRLRQRVCEEGLGARFFMFVGAITAVPFNADVVVFEFSLHELADPRAALLHARRLAPEMVILEHVPGSRWSWFAGEDRGVAAAWAAVSPQAIRRVRTCEAVQHFGDFIDVKVCFRNAGATSQARIVELRNVAPIVIPMPFRLALIDSRAVA